MKVKVLLALVALVAYTEASDVVDMTSDFESLIQAHETVLVKFFAPWCGHCKRLAPEFEDAATLLKTNDPPIILADVDCTADKGKDACSKHGVSGYPTLKIFKNGEVSGEYNGPREAPGIVKYMKSISGPASKELKSQADFDKMLKRDETVIVGFFKEKDSALQKAFLEVADKLREDYSFYHTHDTALADSRKLADDVVIIRAKKFQSKFENDEEVYDGSPDATALTSFIKKKYFGLVGHRTRDNENRFEKPLLVAFYEVDYTKNIKGTNYWRNRIMKAVKDFAGKLSFAVSDRVEFNHEFDDFNLKMGPKPQIIIRDEVKRYRMEEDFSIENLNKFVQKYLDDELEPVIRSEMIPTANDGPVKVAVALNFEELILNADKDVFIEFYAPWCGHCKKLAPVFEELGRDLQDEDILIVKMDVTLNDVPREFDVHGFPTLYWQPKNNKQDRKKYEGGRELKDFIQYVAKHSTDELKKYDRDGNRRDGTKSEL